MLEIFPPSPKLEPYIENYWRLCNPDFQVQVNVFVDLRADLIFNYGAPYQRALIGGPAQRYHQSNLDAQRLHPIRITQSGAIHTVGVRFRSGGLGPFCRLPLSQFNDRTCPPEEAFGEGILDLQAVLSQAQPAHPLDEYFQARLNLSAAFVTFWQLKQSIELAGGAQPIAALCRQAGVSLRAADRLFSQYLGVGPKTFARVCRFQRALAWLMKDDHVSLVEVATNCGYYDQSHFVKEFRLFAGGVPRGYKGYFPPQGPHDFAPNVVHFLQDNTAGPDLS